MIMKTEQMRKPKVIEAAWSVLDPPAINCPQASVLCGLSTRICPKEEKSAYEFWQNPSIFSIHVNSFFKKKFFISNY